MESRFAGKAFIVTGAASGMGLATAQVLMSQGASVAWWDVNRQSQEKEISNLPKQQQERAISAVVDVTNRATVSSALQAAKSKFGAIHGIVNYAGAAGHKNGTESVWETSDEEFDYIMRINVKGLFILMGEALKPGLLAEPGGSFVHISSMFAERGCYKAAIFSASKHAANGMVVSAARECGSRGIRVNVLMPGPIKTPMYDATISGGSADPVGPTPLPRLGQPVEVANIAALLLSDESSYVTGSTWTVDGGANC